MEIIVLIKPVPDLDKIKLSRAQGQIFETGKRIMNSYDRVGLQLAIDLKQTYGGHVSVISICDLSKTDILRDAFAMGADDCYNLWEEFFENHDAFIKTWLLGTAIHKIGKFDLIICGAKSDHGFSGQIGPRLAELMNLPQATSVTKIELIEKAIKLETKLFNEKSLSLPALITVDHSAAIPKIPTAINIMKAFKKEINTWKVNDLGLTQHDLQSLVKIRSRFLTEG